MIQSITISTKNTKLGIIPSINLPPIITCSVDAPCKKLCYACKGSFMYPKVKNAALKNLEIYKTAPGEYFKQLEYFLKNPISSYKYFRYHSSGDIPDAAYLLYMIKLAKKLKNINFLAFTKKYDLINDYLKFNKIPSNLVIIFSSWDGYAMSNPYLLPVAYVKLKKPIDPNYKIPSTARACSGDCTNCLYCFNMKKSESVFFNQH